MPTDNIGSVRCFVLDMDGTVYLGSRLLPGALEFFEYLRRSGRDFLFVTNNSSRHAEYYSNKLTSLGIACDAASILTSGEATAFYLNTLKPKGRIFLLGTPELEEEFASHGFTLMADPAPTDATTASVPDFVVLGFDKTLTYAKLVTACDWIRRGVPFIATHPDFNCPTESGYIPDCGAMAALITASTGVRPKVIGKPNREIIDMIRRKKNYQPEQLAIVGDRLYTDMTTGFNARIRTVLVLSGETKAADLAGSSIQPDYVCRDLAELTEQLRQGDEALPGI
ncbi:MAG: HAD-IIA family hydrolase [Candidatus Korobacteraceae bacterium]|jgi:HAD superfamily hydrolase (TIGR01457 family)